MFFLPGAMATDYYVSKNGNDGNTGLSIENAWGSIDHAVDHINAGDLIYVLEGTYNEFISVSKDGTNSNYKTLKNYNNDVVIVKRDSYGRTGIDIDADFWVIDGFHITHTSNPITIADNKKHIHIKNLECFDIDAALIIGDGANNIIIENCKFYDPYDGGVNFIGLRGEDDRISHHILITGCSFDGCGHNSINMWDTGKDEDFYGLFDVTIEDCTFTDGTQIAIATNHFAVERLIVRDCVFINYHRGIQCCMRDSLIENCVVINHKAHFVYCSYDSQNSDVTVRHIIAHAQKHDDNDRCIILGNCVGQNVYNITISGHFIDANSDYVPSPIKPTPLPTSDPDDYDIPTEDETPYMGPTPYPIVEPTDDEFYNEFGYQNYSASPDWDYYGDINSNVVRHYYQWNNRLTSKENAQMIYNPVYFGLPNTTDLSMGGGPIQWTYLRIIGPKYAVYYNNTVYSNSSDVIYEVGYLPRPSRSLDGVTIDSVTVSELYHKTNAAGNDMLTINITCEWHKSQRTARGIRKQFYTTILYQETRNTITKWENVEEYNEIVECVITNHSGFYNTIGMDNLPGNAANYNISVVMGNVTKYLLKSSFVFFKNDTVQYQLYDMYDYDFYDLYGISPYGKDCFLLPNGYIDNVSVVVSSPFESYELKTNITRIDEIKNTYDLDIYAVIMCLLTVYVLYRWFIKW